MILRKKTGYATITSPTGLKEFDTCTCKHCGRVWAIKSTEKGQGDLGGWCRTCQGAICPTCVGKDCTPFMKRIKEYEVKMKFRGDFENVTL
jgi:hypothetical protein